MTRSKLLITFIAIVAVLSIPASIAIANGKLDEVLANMERAARGIKGIEADLRQEKRDMQIGGKEIYSGKIYFQHSGKDRDRLRINYTLPEGQIVIVDGDKILLYREAGALPPGPLEQLLQQIKGLNMDDIRAQMAREEVTGEA